MPQPGLAAKGDRTALVYQRRTELLDLTPVRPQ